jgi:hypothetical protein
LEFFMGIRFHANTWRAPLQLIDCWLPDNQPIAPARPTAMPRSLQNFVRAGWLNRVATTIRPFDLAPVIPDSTTRPCATVHNIDAHRRTSPPRPKTFPRTDARLVISGRIGDVCAELDRLAALEFQAIR